MLKAAELQENSPESSRIYEPGISEEELHKLAAEFGISPEYLTMALASVQDQPPQKEGFKLFGVPYRVEHERIVEGELSPEDFEVILDELPMTSHLGLIPSQVGRTLNVKNPRNAGAFELICKSGKGRTRIITRTANFTPAFATFYPAFLFSLFAIIGTAKEGMPLLGILISLGLFTAAGAIFRPWARFANRRAAELVDRIQAVVARVARRDTAEVAPVTEAEGNELRNRLTRPG